jgi:hypothetical protein
MRKQGISLSICRAQYCAIVLLVVSVAAMAQRHGGATPAPGLGTISRPDGVDEKDTLKDFHHALAVQATSQQIAEFRVWLKNTEAAKAELLQFQKRDAGTGARQSPLPDAALVAALDAARSDHKKFTAGFSDAQKSGLKEITKRLEKASFDLEQEEKKLDQILQGANTAGPEMTSRAESLGKVLTGFYNQQFALGREMSITLANGQDLTFSVPAVNTSTRIADRAVVITVSGALTQIAAERSQRTFKLEVVADLSDLQQNITGLLRAQLDRSDRCGERIAIRQAMLTPWAPASNLRVQLHYERWTCTGMYGQVAPNEVAESEGTAEFKLSATVETSNALKVTAALGSIQANGMLADALRSGDLGDDLRDKVTQSVLSAMQAAADFKATLPPAVQNGAMVQTAKFQDGGAGDLRVVFEG